jgi:hypothetical protein
MNTERIREYIEERIEELKYIEENEKDTTVHASECLEHFEAILSELPMSNTKAPNGLTIERMREIIKGVLSFDTRLEEGEADAVTGTIINHPEIKSLFEQKECEVRGNKVNNWGGGWHMQWGCSCKSGYCLNYMQKYCEHCGAELIWPTNEPTKTIEAVEQGEVKPPYIVKDEVKDFRCNIMHCLLLSPKCKRCKHFLGHHEQGKSIRCGYGVNKEGKGE